MIFPLYTISSFQCSCVEHIFSSHKWKYNLGWLGRPTILHPVRRPCKTDPIPFLLHGSTKFDETHVYLHLRGYFMAVHPMVPPFPFFRGVGMGLWLWSLWRLVASNRLENISSLLRAGFAEEWNVMTFQVISDAEVMQLAGITSICVFFVVVTSHTHNLRRTKFFSLARLGETPPLTIPTCFRRWSVHVLHAMGRVQPRFVSNSSTSNSRENDGTWGKRRD